MNSVKQHKNPSKQHRKLVPPGETILSHTKFHQSEPWRPLIDDLTTNDPLEATINEIKLELEMDMQDDLDLDRIRNNRELLALFYAMHTKTEIHRLMPEVCSENGSLQSGYWWLGDWSKGRIFRILYDHRSITKILKPCSDLSPTTSTNSYTSKEKCNY